ncbi:hypothetical protein [Bradyrhizobium sp. 45]|uniref:hypothetical protein n=1 Tax=Bradyrhizobium sp. 45 TaxID=1043587 RepID=UPI001FF79570|nr:hypothetical protein [Bradyrhizobium sp. 45]MCK1307634.1 hypothetical protein [Bradyrhizobium sp. 45]
MNEARQGFVGKTGGAFERAFTIAAKWSIAAELENLVGAPMGGAEQSVKDPPTGTVVDFVFTLNDSGERIAVLVVGPYTNRKLYAHRCADWVTNAFGLCWFYDRVVLALPDRDSMKEYGRRATIVPVVPDTAPAKPRLDVLHISVSYLTDEEDEALGKMSDITR